jgi:hypothetical protein
MPPGFVLALLAILIVVHLASWPVVLIVSVIEGGAGAIFYPAATAVSGAWAAAATS